MNATNKRYAGFGRRLVAGLIDFVMVMVASVCMGQLGTQSKGLSLFMLPMMWAFMCLYEPTMHARFGATLGKFALGIRVVRLDGHPIGWPESLRRSSVMLVAHAYWLFHVAPAALSLPATAFFGQGWVSLFLSLKADLPPTFEWLEAALGCWLLAEFITMQFNRQRRALHDFLGGTAVVVRSRGALSPPPA